MLSRSFLKESKILHKKFERSEKNRAGLEEINEKNQLLLAKLLEESQLAREEIQSKSEQLSVLTAKLAKYLARSTSV